MDNLKRPIIPFFRPIRDVHGDGGASDYYYSKRGATSRGPYRDALPQGDCLARFWCARVHLGFRLFRPTRGKPR